MYIFFIILSMCIGPKMIRGGVSVVNMQTVVGKIRGGGGMGSR